jgi:hypothetical protein
MHDIKEIASTPIFRWLIFIKLSACLYGNTQTSFQTMLITSYNGQT